jgi:hypothetical protein
MTVVERELATGRYAILMPRVAGAGCPTDSDGSDFRGRYPLSAASWHRDAWTKWSRIQRAGRWQSVVASFRTSPLARP